VASPDSTDCDVVVIGGGINGTGVARDLSLRGLSVVLYERNDLAFGASGNSSGMIHGGPRYMTTNPEVTRTSCEDSGFIQHIAPHLLFRIPFLVPVVPGPSGRMWLELIDAFFRAYDDYQPLKHGEKHTRLTPEEARQLEPGLAGEMSGVITFDEWGVDGARLCVLNAVDAENHGAKIHVHTTVEGIAATGTGGDARDLRYVVTARKTDGAESSTVTRVRARVVVNATGAWGPVTAALGGFGDTAVKVRPGKGIHVAYDRRLSNYGIVTNAIDGRQIFLQPWQNMSVIATTDDDYFGDLDAVTATSEEVRYLVQGIAGVFPQVREARATLTWAGVRPTLYKYGPHEDSLSREHEIIDHGKPGPGKTAAPGVYSMIGGKLASYRIFAQEMSDRVARDLAPESRCRTHLDVLPGGDRLPDSAKLAEASEITPVAARRLTYRHGSIAEQVTERIAREPRERAVICACEPVLEAEVRHVVEKEHAETIEDVARRTRLGLGSCGGMRCAARCGQILADARGLSPRTGRAMARRFLETQARARIPAMGPEQARQEALLVAQMRASLGEHEP
jgi:glycerol-3-phosphate dehydrogenase